MAVQIVIDAKNRVFRTIRPKWTDRVPSFVPEWWKNGAPDRIKLCTPISLLYLSIYENV
jgi:hypothetical protein